MSERTCTLCDERYAAGEYRRHAEGHTPLRRGRQGPGRTAPRDDVLLLVAEGLSIAEIARRVGMSRQRVHQLVREDAQGRPYRADRRNEWARNR